MTVAELISELELDPIHVADNEEAQVAGVYCGDLLSDVLAHCPPEAVWFTVQGHLNTVAVADLRDAVCVVVVNGVSPDAQAVAKAQSQGVTLCGSQATGAELVMKLAGKIGAG